MNSTLLTGPQHRLAKHPQKLVMTALSLLAAMPLLPRPAYGQVATTSIAASLGQGSCQINSNQMAVTVRIQVLDGSGASLPEARVAANCANVSVTAQSATDGFAELKLPPGRYRILVQHPGFADFTSVADLAQSTEPFTIGMHVGSTSQTVNVTADTGFVPYSSDTGSKTGALLAEVPQTISVISQRELEARNVVSLTQALQYTPGVKGTYEADSRFDWFMIRGFDSGSLGVFRDGMRWSNLLVKIDPFELESIEVIQGPASVLYGQVPPGGMVNLTSKRPSAETHREIGIQYGQYDRRQLQADFGGLIDHNQVWRYRLLGVIRNSGTQVNFTPDNRRLIAPSLSWHPSDRTNVTVFGDWQHDNTKWLQFLPMSGTLTSNPNGIIPVSAFVGEPGWEKVIRDQPSLAYVAEHAFQDGWEIHQNYRYQHNGYNASTLYGSGFVTGSNSTLKRTAAVFPVQANAHTLDTRALRRFATSKWQHTVLGGYDYLHQRNRASSLANTTTTIDIFHPVYGVNLPTTFTVVSNYDQSAQQHGAYLQDQIKFKQHLVVSLGGREDWAITDYSNFLASTHQNQNKSKFTGRAGVLYLGVFGLHPYYSYSTSFQPVTGSTDYSGNQFSPTYGQQQEGGIKFQPRTWNSFITASLFTITQHNVLVADPDPTHVGYSIQTGAIRSRGLELEGVANLARGWNLHAGYSFNPTRVTETTVATQLGKESTMVPRHSTSLLADYTVPRGPFAGFGGNLGVRFSGKLFGDILNTIPIPNYTLLDGALRFSFRGAQIGVNGSNLIDKRYVVSCGSTSSCYYGSARNVVGSVRYRF